jgi:dynein heavy chain 1
LALCKSTILPFNRKFVFSFLLILIFFLSKRYLYQVVDKYYLIQKELISRFADKLLELSNTLMSNHLTATRKQLESQSFDFNSTPDIVSSVTLLQSLNKKSQLWRSQLDAIKAGEKLLHQQRFQFPESWLFVDRIEGEWKTFEQILNRRLNTLAMETPVIQSKIIAEDQVVDRHIKELLAEWKNVKPVQGDIVYTSALNSISVFESKLIKIEDSLAKLLQVKRALELPILSNDENRLVTVRDELNALKDVWQSLSTTWSELNDLKERRFVEIKVSDIRKLLTNMTSALQLLPNHVRQYDCYEFLRNTLKSYASVNVLFVDLGSGTLRAKHQKLIQKSLRLSGQWTQVTLGQLWSADLKSHEKELKSILEMAQGEGALEEFLQELNTSWEQTRFDFVEYKSRCHLIKNWDTLTAFLASQISDLSSMSQSPYFKTFEREAQDWSIRLNKAHAIFDVFIELQRKWVYLEGVFNNSADVQTQLQVQYSKFKSFDREFVKLMHSIKLSPAVDFWVQDDKNMLSKLESFIDTLTSIQKALGEYLQKQREAFPRFFFVGDEDLLEILGNGNDPSRVNRHLSKMFAGIVALRMDDSGASIIGMQSKEGEFVPFVDRILLRDNASVHKWLSQVENQMQITLATLLEDAVSQAATFKGSLQSNSADSKKSFFSWIDRYPAQIVLLGMQISWSEKVESILKSSTRESVSAPMSEFLAQVMWLLDILADAVLLPLSADTRKKYEQLITEFVRQRNVLRSLIAENVFSSDDFTWMYQMRFYAKVGDSHQPCHVSLWI